MSSKQKHNKTWSPDEVETLITAFEACPTLWDYKKKEYKNRVKTNLLNFELSEMFSTTPEEIARKLHNLKGQFSQEVAKLKKRRAVAVAVLMNVSSWRYFNALSFLLQGKEYQRNATDTLTDPSTPAENQDTGPQQRAESQLPSVSDEQPSSSIQNEYLPHPPSKKKKEDTSVLNNCAQILNQPYDDDQIFADYVASELRKLSKEGNKKLRRIIQRAIINIQDEDDGLVPPMSINETL